MTAVPNQFIPAGLARCRYIQKVQHLRQGYQAAGVLRQHMAEIYNPCYSAQCATLLCKCALSSPGCCQQLRPAHSHAAASPGALSLQTAPAHPPHKCIRHAPGRTLDVMQHAGRCTLHLAPLLPTHQSKAACRPCNMGSKAERGQNNPGFLGEKQSISCWSATVGT